MTDTPAPDATAVRGVCPTCASRDRARHPAAQSGGEVSLCPDPWHGLLAPPAPAPAALLANDVVDLVIAAREVMDEGHVGETFGALDKALEAFASRVPYENEPDGGAACRACGCTEASACVEPFSGDPCAWWDDDICTACAGIVQRFFSPEELTFLLHAAGGGDLNLTRPDATALTAEGVLHLRARLACLAPKKEAADD